MKSFNDSNYFFMSFTNLRIKNFQFKFLMFCFLLCIYSNSKAQIVTDDFNYTAASLLTANGWTAINGAGTNAITVTTPGLTYTGYAGTGIGNAVSLTTTGEDDSKSFTAITSGSIYYSAMVNVSAAQATGDYFMALNGSAFCGRLYVKSSGAGYVFGLGKTTETTPAYESTIRSFNTTYLVIIKYVYVTGGTTNDLVSLWINPVLGGPEPSADIAGWTSANTDATTLSSILLRQGNAANAATVRVDGIRVGTTWQSVASTVNGIIGNGEYGSHIDGENQQTNGSQITYMNWDSNNLYIGVAGANTSEAFILYLDKDPQIPVDGGSNANGTNVGQLYDVTNFANLQNRADLVLYVKNSYREYRTSNGSNGWNAGVSGFGLYADVGTTRELSIPWSVIGGKPNSFNFFSYLTSSGGIVYGQVPIENASGSIGTSARYSRYYTVSSTTIGSSTFPFSRNSYVFNSSLDISSFGSISCYDFTMNTSGRFISRTGATAGNWAIAGNLVIGNGTIYFGSGGPTYGTSTVTGNLDIRGGTLDMDQTSTPLTVNGNLELSSGNLKLSNVIGGDFNLNGNWNNSGGVFTPNSRLVSFLGTPLDQTISNASGETFAYLKVNKAAGKVSLANNITVNNILTFTSGSINTSTNKLSISSTGSIAGAGTGSGWVVGNLQKNISAIGVKNFEVGDASLYRPINIDFSALTSPGDLTATVTQADGNHASISTSGLDNTKTIKRYWTLTNSGIGGTYDATFNFINPTDINGSANTANLVIRKYNGTAWSTTTTGIRTSTSTQCTGLTTFSDFAIGEANTLTVATDPLDVTICTGSSTTFTSTSNSLPAPFIQWQRSLDGGVNWSNISSYNLDGANTSYSTSSGNTQLNLTGSTTTLNGYQYRASFININGTVYSAAKTLTVNGLATANAGDNATTTICSSATYAVTNAAVTNNASFSWSTNGDGSFSPSNTTLNPTYTPGTTDISNGTVTITLTAVGNSPCGNVSSSKVLTISSGYVWNGAADAVWTNSANWSVCGIPSSGSDVTIATTGSNPNLPANTTVGALTINAGSALGIGSNTLTINGAVSGTGTITGSASSSLVFAGTASTINFTAGAGNNYLKDLTVSGSMTIGSNGLNITDGATPGSVTVTGTLNTGDLLTLKSDEFGTARVGQSSGTINGKVTIERFIKAHRAWRFITAPVQPGTAPTINAAWQEGVTTGAGNPNAGFGTHITGGNNTAAGFDLNPSGSFSTKQSTTSNVWDNITNTLTNTVTTQNGYMVFVRGSRANQLNLGVSAPTDDTRLRVTGELKQGAQNFADNFTGISFKVIGNPYASAISIPTLWGGFPTTYSVWDPKLTGSNGVGAFVQYSWSTTNSNWTRSAVPASNLQDGVVESGSAFLLQYPAGPATFSLDESNKIAGSNMVQNPTTAGEEMRVNLNKFNADATVSLQDGMITTYDAANDNAVDNADARKANNFAQQISSNRDGIHIAIERRAIIVNTDTTYINMSGMTAGNYQFDLQASNLNHPNLLGKLVDNYLGSAAPLDLNGNTVYPFTVDANAGSFAADRFKIVYYPATPLPVSFTSINAYQQGQANAIRVDWKVDNQVNIKEYQVERAADGRSFSSIGRQLATGANGASANYSLLDAAAFAGDNFYRIKSIGLSGDIQYSRIVKVKIGKSNPMISIFPNPVTERVVTLQFTDMPKGNYTVSIVNPLGQTVQSKQINHIGASAAQTMGIDRAIAKGNYQLKIVQPDGAVKVLKLVIVE